MSNFKANGYTYEVIVRPWKKGKSRYECIRWMNGMRNLWDRISVEQYNEAAKKANKPIITTQ